MCGEPCSQQICPLCAPKDKKKDIVDLIMQRTLADLDSSSRDVAERIITLDCGHTFTVETLDGHCSMTDYYDVDAMGTYLAMKAPPTGYQLPPTCPTCRGPIASPRYGRVTKRATLDIMEQNVASTMSKSLESLNPDMERISNDVATMEAAAKKVSHDMDNVSDPSKDRSAAGKLTEALPARMLDGDAMRAIHGLSATEAKSWNAVVKELLKVYRRAHKFSTTRGAHVKAFEGALTTLYRLELDAIANDPTRATDTPEPLAMEAVQKKIGQAFPKADVRFQVEAYFTLLELRFILGQVAVTRIEALPTTATHEAGTTHRGIWTSFVQFLYDSCCADAKKARAMADKSSASRLAVRCEVYAIRSAFEAFRFRIMTDRHNLLHSTTPNPNLKEDRDRLADEVKAERTRLGQDAAAAKQQYVRSRPVKTTEDMLAEHQWFDENCTVKVKRFAQSLEELEASIRKDKTYQALSMQERAEIVKAFDFGERKPSIWRRNVLTNDLINRVYRPLLQLPQRPSLHHNRGTSTLS